jgi:NAD(P)H dehydrogenase (quinone)
MSKFLESGSIAVTGASGNLGRLVVAQLLERVPGDQVIAIGRDIDRVSSGGAHVRRGDYDDPASLRAAFAGATVLLLISSPELDTERRVAQHQRAIEAAVDAGVQTLVYTSFLGAQAGGNPLTEAHQRTEQAIADSGLSFTCLRHPFYSEAFLNAGLREALASGELTSRTAGRGLNTASRTDLAAAAVAVLTDTSHRQKSYELTGTLWSFPELAAMLSEVGGSPVRYSEAACEIPGPLGWLHALARAGALEQQSPDLQVLLARPPRSLREAVSDALGR